VIVIILEKAPPRLKGELTRWLHEPRTNVFVGRVSAQVRRLLWQKVKAELGPTSGALLVHHSDDEPGFRIETHGDTTRRLQTFDGLQLIQRDHPNSEKALRKLAARLPTGARRNFDWSCPPGETPPDSDGKDAPSDPPIPPSDEA
jgi:CRISPR-associated protein Cas2